MDVSLLVLSGRIPGGFVLSRNVEGGSGGVRVSEWMGDA